MFMYTYERSTHGLMLEPGATYISVQVCKVAVVLAFDLSFDFTFKPTGSRYWYPYSVYRLFTLPS